MAILTREAILRADDLKFEDVEVPEWNGTVRVSMMTGALRDAFAASLQADGKPAADLYQEKLLVATIIDEAGAPMFTYDDIAALAKKSAVALDRVVKVAERINSVGNGAVEAAAKN